MADGSAVAAGGIPAAAAPPHRAGTLKRLARRRSTLAFLMTLPLLAVIGGLVVYPFFYAVELSMLNKRMTRFVGLDNFTFLVGRETFQLVVFQSVLFAVSAVVAKALIGFVLAHVLHALPAKGQRKWRGMLLVPWVIPPAISTLAWWWLFDPSYSAFNWALAGIGAGPVPWLGDAGWARFAVILVNVWYGAPFFMIMYLAALKSVPDQLYEAAAIDGATGWQAFWRITLPAIRWGLVYGIVLSTARAIGEFGAVSVVSGKVSGETETLTLLVEKRFQNFDLSGAYAASTLLAVIALVTLGGMVLVNRRKELS